MKNSFIPVEENNLKLDDAYTEFIQDIYQIYQKTENKSETQRQVNNKLQQADLDTISYPQVGTILTSRLVIGRLEYAGEVVTTDSELQVIDKSLFQEVQTLLSDQGTRSESVSKPDFLQAAGERYGAEFVLELIDICKPLRCRSCGGNLEREDSTEVCGITMPNYSCQDCDYQGALINEEELQNLHQALPLRCPYCTATEEFEATELREAGTKFDYQYRCDLCECSFGSNMQPDRLRRMLNHPALKFSINADFEDDKRREEDSDEDNDQHSIGDFR